MFRKIALAIGLALGCTALWAEDSGFNPQRFSVDQGLPHTDVGAVTQDASGFIWIGTYSGLCRYDGTDLKVFNISNSILRSSRIFCLQVMPDGLLYIGTETGGFTMYDTSSQKFVDTVDVPSNCVNAIFPDSDSRGVWIGTDSGLSHFTVGRDGSKHLESWNLDFIVHDGAAIASSSDVLLATSDGLVLFNSISGHTQLASGYFTDLEQIPGGRYVACSYSGTCLYDISSGMVSRISNLGAKTAEYDGQGHVLIGTVHSGIVSLDADSLREADSFACENVNSLFQDNSGVLWIGTIGEGCLVSNVCSRIFRNYRIYNDGASHTETAMMYDSMDRLWIGTRDGDLFVLDVNGRLKAVDRASLRMIGGQPVSAITQLSNGDLLLGSWEHGLFRLGAGEMEAAASGRQFKLTPVYREMSRLSIYKIVEDASCLWISTNAGVWRAHPDGTLDRFQYSASNPATPIDNFTTDICVDRRDSVSILWAGSRSGLTRFICAENGMIRRIDRLSGDFVSAIHKSSSGDIWVASLGVGLERLVSDPMAETPEFRRYMAPEFGFTSNEIESIQEDSSGNLWLGGFGLMRFNPDAGTVLSYTKEDGLQGNAFKIWASAKASDGSLAFGGISGFNVFHPESIKINTIAPQMAITDVMVNDTECDAVSGEILLPYTDNNINISFAALHYARPQRNHYRYILEGVDSDWHLADGYNTAATYFNLRPGTYRFKVYGANSDGVWSDTPAELHIRILPPWYASMLARIIYIILALGLSALLIIYLYRKQARDHAADVQRKLDAEQKERNEKELKFQTDFLHEVKTPLSLIEAPVEDLLSQQNLGKNTREKLRLILQSAHIIEKHIEEVTDLRRYDNSQIGLKVVEVDFCRFVTEIVTLFQPVMQQRDITFSVEADGELPVYLDKRQFEKVVINLMSNAVKFSPERGGVIRVKVWKEQDSAKLSVSNMGIGILPEDKARIFDRFAQGANNDRGGMGIGLSISHYIVEAHSGTISVDSIPGAETVFTVGIPLGSAHFSKEDIDTSYSNSDSLSNYDPLPELMDKPLRDAVSGDRVLTVMVVDDSAQLREYFKEMLSPTYNVLLAKDGQDGYERAIAEQPDLVLTDVVMPVMNGLELCSRIKGNRNTSHIPVILVSARDLPVHKIEGYQMQADDYITKPFHSDELLARIDNLIASRETMRESLRTEASVEPSAIAVTPMDEKFINNCVSFIEKNMSDPDYGVDQLSQDMAISRPQLYRKIKTITGQSAVQFMRSMRLKRAAQLLASGGMGSVSEVMEAVGFSNLSYFSKIFYSEFQCLPKDYRG